MSVHDPIGFTSALSCPSLAPEAIASADFDPSDASELWDITNRQDWAICESVQRGIAARPHEHGYYAPMEDFSLDIRRYVTERLSLTDHAPTTT